MADTLAQAIKGDVVTPGHPEYDAAISRWSKDAERKARFVVLVKDAGDVAASLSYAKAHSIPIAIRCGGINPVASSVEDGIVIDLSRYLNKVRVDADSKLAYVGGGAYWRDVDSETVKHGLAAVSAFGNVNGVGGWTVYGGYGWLSGRYGLTSDNLAQVTIVTADGLTLTANDVENKDLFWAIRGGGGDFGVVTEFVYHLHPQTGTVFGGVVIFTPDKLEQLVEVTKQWYPTIKDHEGQLQVVTVGPGGPCISVIMFFNGSEEEGRANFKDFFDIGPSADTCKAITYDQMNTILQRHGEYGRSFGSSNISHDPPLYPTAEVVEEVTKINKEAEYDFLCLYEYLPLKQANSIDATATPIPRPLRQNIWSLLQWTGNAPQHSLAGWEHLRRFREVLIGKEASESPDAYLPHPLLNHSATSPSLIFGPNYARVCEVKNKYDPDCLFDAFKRWKGSAPSSQKALN